MGDLKRSSFQSFTPNNLTFDQIRSVYDSVEDIISNLDEYALNEIFSGTSRDIDHIFEDMVSTTTEVLFFNGAPIKTNAFSYLEKLTDNFDRELKRRSLNYFIMSVLPNFEMNFHHIEWGNLVMTYIRLGVLAARDHGKSYFFSFAYVLWRLWSFDRYDASKKNRLSKKGVIITNEQSLAMDFIRMVKEEIENNPFLKEKLFPRTNSDGWAKGEIFCENGASVSAKGSNSSLRGRHPGWIVVDDYLDESCLYSETIRNNYVDYFNSVIMNALLPDGQILIVGTPFHQKDIYGRLKLIKGWRVFDFPAIFPNGQLLWPQRHSLESLMLKRDMFGSLIFSREILVKPIMSDSTIFPWSILEKSFVGMGEYSLAENIMSFPKKFKKVSVGCDFAISSSIGADYTVFSVVGTDENENFWLIYQWKAKGASYNEQIANLKRIRNNFNPDVIMAEDNVFQKVMIQIAQDNKIDVVPHTTGINKYDLKSGLPGLAVLFEQSRIKFPRGDVYSRNVTDTICLQASSITWTDEGKLETTGEHDDDLYSLWIGVRGAHYVNQSFSYTFI